MVGLTYIWELHHGVRVLCPCRMEQSAEQPDKGNPTRFHIYCVATS